jgi:alpha-mannosidase
MRSASKRPLTAEFTQKMAVVVSKPGEGPLPKRHSFVTLKPDGVQLSSLRAKPNSQLEMRLVEVEGQETAAIVSLNLPLKSVVETDLLGDGSRPVASAGNQFNCRIRPWKVQTFSIT